MSHVLIHIGLHKTATTWLQRHLFDRREAGFSAPWSIADVIDHIVRPHPLEWDEGAARRLGMLVEKLPAVGILCLKTRVGEQQRRYGGEDYQSEEQSEQGIGRGEQGMSHHHAPCGVGPGQIHAPIDGRPVS